MRITVDHRRLSDVTFFDNVLRTKSHTDDGWPTQKTCSSERWHIIAHCTLLESSWKWWNTHASDKCYCYFERNKINSDATHAGPCKNAAAFDRSARTDASTGTHRALELSITILEHKEFREFCSYWQRPLEITEMRVRRELLQSSKKITRDYTV